ncbi:MAG: ABC transporter ATP-binding protein, partial [Sphingobacteriia bacterium]|nr:ABC transporter ATP-binding protein [Sphingobacteriia bacterium]
MENEVLIKLNNVELTYNDGKPNAFRALQGINLEIKKNSFVIIFGPSGCGKSSLLNVISGLEKPDKGEVFVSGNNLVKMSQADHVKFHRDTIGMVFQSYNLITTLSVLDNVAIPQIFTSNRKSAREEKALSLLERFGIRPQADKLPSELSGGQQQRIGIARAIINDQPIILADEPVGNLDSKSANNVMQIMSELNKDENKTIVMVSHNPENIIWGDH